MKRLYKVLAVIVLLLACIIIFKDLIIKSVVTMAASKITGVAVHMDTFSINIFSSVIHISGFKMSNPSGFPEDVMVSCPTINVMFDRSSLFQKKPHFLLVDIDLKDMIITKNKEGKLNVDSLKIVKPASTSAPTPIQIDLLNLSIGQIVYKDYTVVPKPSVRVDNINRHQSYKSIPTIEQLLLLVLAEPMKAALIKNAEIYGTAMLTGVGFIPVAIAATFIGKDNVQQSIDTPIERVYKISLEVIRQMGTITHADESNEEIKANINGSTVSLKLIKNAESKTDIIISARKYMLPQVDIAGGVLFEILNKL